MITPEEIIKKHFQDQEIVNTFQAEVLKRERIFYGIPFGDRSWLKISLLSPIIKIVETKDYWFIDTRFQLKPWWAALLFPFWVQVIYIFLAAIFLNLIIYSNISFGLVLMGVVLFFLGYHTNSSMKKGFYIEVFDKNWCDIEKSEHKFTMNITIPKTARAYNVSQYTSNSRLMPKYTSLGYSHKIIYKLLLNKHFQETDLKTGTVDCLY